MRHILEWIDINEQSPGFKQECIIQLENGEVEGGWLYSGKTRFGEHVFIESHADYEMTMGVIFWMALPPAIKLVSSLRDF
ncbi:hypothetical protein [Pantoea sp. App145]|uniref:hypothetical protein n=1 Tax=Pantoea sp. App145 TaxID=3071567 RepID=UPI003A7FA13B